MFLVLASLVYAEKTSFNSEDYAFSFKNESFVDEYSADIVFYGADDKEEGLKPKT
jgi:hypothetical protein